MNDKMVTFISRTVVSLTSMLILGEIFGDVISKPITAWRSQGIDKTKLKETIRLMKERISNLEETEKEA